MNNQNKSTESGKIRLSITSKLNTRLFLRLLGIFLSLNIVICLIAAGALAYYSEKKVIGALEKFSGSEPPAETNSEWAQWMQMAGLSVRTLAYSSDGNLIEWPFSRYLPYETEKAVMGFRMSPGRTIDSISSITYIVQVSVFSNDYGRTYEVGLQIGQFILYFIYAFLALLVFELLTLFSRTINDRRMVRRTLGPIADLARAAQTLNDVNRQLDPEKMMVLAGKLDGIDAGRLDTRIQIDDMQEELKSVAVAINGLLDRINESYAAQTRFVSDASHELRTPISVIQGYANLLDRWGKDDEKALLESVSAIKDEAGNMKELVEQLLFLARGDSNRISLVRERIDALGLIGEVISETRMLDKGHEFKIAGSDVIITADRSLLKQALRILIDNAIKYTDNDGEITISAIIDGWSARISVSDNGIGIAPEILPFVFDRFVRADESRARSTGGSGLGLSIAQWIISRHNGHIEVISREGIGTRITLILPTLADSLDSQMIATPQSPQTAAFTSQ